MWIFFTTLCMCAYARSLYVIWHLFTEINARIHFDISTIFCVVMKIYLQIKRKFAILAAHRDQIAKLNRGRE